MVHELKNKLKKGVFVLVLSLLMVSSLFSVTDVSAENVYVPTTSVGNQTLTIRGYSDNSTSGFRSSQTLELVANGFASNAKLKYTYVSHTTAIPFEVVDAVGTSDVAIRQANPLQSLRAERSKIPYKESKGNWFQKAAIAIQNAAIAIANVAIELENIAIRLLNAITKAENSLIELDNSRYQASITTTSNVFRVQGNNASPYVVEITVKDENTLSSTYNRTATATYGGYASASLFYDASGSYGMFTGDVTDIRTLAEDHGVGHVSGCSGTTITNVVGNNNISSSGTTITAGSNPGEGGLSYSISKASYCNFHASQSTGVAAVVYVFRKPTITAVAGGFEIGNTEAGVTYSIGNRSYLCYSDDETIVFDHLACDWEYDIILSKTTSDGRIAKKHVKATTLAAYTGAVNYEKKPNVANIDNIYCYSKYDVVSEPNGPFAPGFVLEGWYDDATFTTKHDFSQKVTSNFTVYGKWEGLKNSLNLTINANGASLTDATVELYQNGNKVATLTEKENKKGTYSISDAIVNGTYQVYINGLDSKSSIDVATKKTAKDISSELLDQRLTGDTLNITLNVKQLSVVTYVDNQKSSIASGNISMFNGYKLDESIYVDDAYVSYYEKNDSTNYDVFFNGSDSDSLSGEDASKNVGDKKLSANLYFNTITANIVCDDEDWISENIVLRKENGAYVATLNATSYDSISKTRKYTAVLINDDNETPTEYYIYVENINTGVTVTSTSEGKDATLNFDTAKVTLNLDGQAYTNAEIIFSNDLYSYDITKNNNGEYTAHLYRDGEGYSYRVVGVTDTKTHTEYTNELNYYTVQFKSYEKDGDNSNCIDYRKYTVLENEKIAPPKDAYYAGLTFVCWNENEFVVGEEAATSFDFTNPILTTKTFYAHFKSPSVEINGYVKCDENGASASKGTSFIMPNLTIEGYGEGKEIKSIRCEFSNVLTIKVPVVENATLSCQNGSVPEAEGGYITFNGDNSISISFNENVAVKDAQNCLRGIIVTPKQEENVTVQFTVSDKPISVYTEEDWDYVTSSTGEIYTVISEGSTTGKTLTTGNYYVAKDVSFSCDNGNGLVIDGDVKIFIPTGVTLTATGADGSSWNVTGKAGILLPETSTLTVIGSGTLKATGGNAGNGTNGVSGGGVQILSNNGWHALYIRAGGNGGYGGAGAGAGIGTDGGSGAGGGRGGSGCEGKQVTSTQIGYYYSPGNGQDGYPGNKAATCGTFYCSGVNLDVQGGAGGTGGTGGGTASGNAGHDVYGDFWYVTFDHWYNNNYYTATSSAGGGGGGGGQPARAIGNGGTSGGGGGGGASGGYVVDTGVQWANAWGGCGGSGYVNGNEAASNGHGNSTYYNHNRGAGGASDNTGKEITYDDYNVSNEPKYTVTFDSTEFGGEKTVEEYSYFTQTNITVPECITPTGLIFKYWVVTDFGSTYNDTIDPLTEGDTAVYYPGGTISLTAATSGNITLKPVYEIIVAKYGVGTLNIASDIFVPDPPEVIYYTYTVNASVNGVAQDIGFITLKYGSDEYVLSSDGSGVYTYTTDYNLTYDVYYNGADSSVDVSAGVAASLNLNSIELITRLDGVLVDSYSNIQLVGDSGVLCPGAKYINNEAVVGQYQSIGLASEFAESYRIYINEEDTGLTVAPGETKEINYRTITVTMSGNATPNDAILRHGNKDIPMNFNAETRKLTAVALEDPDTEYHLYINNLDTGITNLKFSEGSESTSLTMNECIVKVNGALLEDEQFYPVIDGENMEKTGPGTFRKMVFGEIDKVTIKGKEFDVNGASLDIHTYSVTYNLNGGEGTTPLDNTIYYDHDNITVTDVADIVRNDAQFIGWTLNGGSEIYKAGDVIEDITSEPVFTAAYRLNSEYDLVVSTGTGTKYMMASELADYLKTLNKDEPVSITVQNNCTLPAISLKESDSLTVNDGLEVTIASITNYGNVNIGSDCTVNVTGYVKNLKGSSEDKFIIGERSVLNVGGNFYNQKNLTNNGTLDVTNGTFTNASEDAVVENNGTMLLKNLTNNGYFNNNNVLRLSNDVKENCVNNGVFNNGNGGTIYDSLTGDGTNVPGAGMINNGVFNNDNGKINISIDNTGSVVGGEVVNNRKVVNVEDGVTVNLFGNEAAEEEQKEQEQIEAKEELQQAAPETNICYLSVGGGEINYSGLPYAGSVTAVNDETDKFVYTPVSSLDNPGASYAVLLPTNVTRSGYVFDGWYAASDYSSKKVTQIDVDVCGERVFYAKWKLASEDKTLASQFQATYGGYDIIGNSYCKVASNNASTAVSGLDTATESIFMDEMSNMKSGDKDNLNKTMTLPDVVVEMNVETSDTCAEKAQQAIESSINGNEKATYINITLTKYVGTAAGKTIHETDNPIEVIITYSTDDVPDISDLWRYHDNKAERMSLSESHADGTYYVEKTADNTIVHIFSSKFSEFGLVYVPPVINFIATSYTGYYDGQSHSVVATVTNCANAVISYSVDGGETYSQEVPSIKEVGKINVIAKAEKNEKVVGSTEYSLEILKRPVKLTVAPVSITGLVYDGQSHELITAGETDIDDLNKAHIEYRVDNGDYSSSIPTAKDAGTYTITYKIVTDENHDGGEEKTIEVVIAKKEITINGITAIDKVYDGNLVAQLNYDEIIIEGCVSDEDKGNLEVTAKGSFIDKNVGKDKEVIISDYQLSGLASNNYQVKTDGSQMTAVADITIKSVTITITPNGGYYGSYIKPATARVNELAYGDYVNITLNYSGTSYDGTEINGTTVPEKAGIYTVSAAIDEANYQLNGVASCDFVINKQIVSIPEFKWFSYDGKFHKAAVKPMAGLYNVTENLGGIKAGTYDVILTLIDNNNYRWSNVSKKIEDIDSSATTTLDFVIAQGENYWTEDPSIEDITYGEELIVKYACAYGNRSVSIHYEGTMGTDYSAYTKPTEAGRYRAVFSVPSTDDYEVLTWETYFSILKKEAVLEWSKPGNLTYDGLVKKAYANVTNLLEGDRCVVYTEVKKGNAKDVGDFSYKAVSLSNNNYKLPKDVTSPVYTITPKQIRVSFADVKMVYNGKSQSPSVTFEGLLEGDECMPVFEGGNETSVGSYHAQVVGLSNKNYQLANAKSADWEIIKADVEVNTEDAYYIYYDILGNPVLQTKNNSYSDGTVLEYEFSQDKETVISRTDLKANEEYFIRVKGNDNVNASEWVSFKLPEKTYKYCWIWWLLILLLLFCIYRYIRKKMKEKKNQ